MKRIVLVSAILSALISTIVFGSFFCLCNLQNSSDNSKALIDMSLSDNMMDNDSVVVGFLNDDGSIDIDIKYFCTDYIDISGMKYLPVAVEYYDGEWKYVDAIRYSTYDEDKSNIYSGGTELTHEISGDEKFVRYCFNMYDFCYNPMILDVEKAKIIVGSNRLDLYIPEQSSFKYNMELKKHVDIVLPHKIVSCNSVEFHMYYDNFLKGFCADNLVDKKITGLKSNSHEAFALQGESTVGTTNLNVVLDFDYSKSWGSENCLDGTTLIKSFELVTVDENKGAGHTRNVMLFGDSITAYGIYPEELERMFENDPMDVVLLGTLGKGGKVGDIHEGRGGWSAGTYLSQQEYNGYYNAFYNPDIQGFDFTYYMNANGFDRIDDFVIMLGINDIDRKICPAIVDDYKAIIASVREFSPNCNILIGLPILPCQMEYAIESKVASMQKQKNRRLELWQYLIDEFDNREDEGYYVMPIGICLDSQNDFNVVEKQMSSRNNTFVDVPIDTVHPSEAGFYKISDMIYSYIKYVD